MHNTEPSVLYLTLTGSSHAANRNGGDIYFQNILGKLIAEGINVRVIAINASKEKIKAADFFDPSVKNVHIINLKPKAFTAWDRLKLKTLSPWAKVAYKQDHIYPLIKKIIDYYKIDAVLVNWLFCTLFAPEITSLKINKTIMIANREFEFQKDLIKHGSIKISRMLGWLSVLRVKFLEKKIYKAFDKVIAIGAPDLPMYVPDSRKSVIPCCLEESADRWTYKANKIIFYVGAYGHYPNRLAVNYLLEHIAPKLFAKEPDAKLYFLGTAPHQIEAKYHHPNIEFLGPGTRNTAKDLFLHANLMLCPVENTYGQKMKVAEALSYGTPFLASAQTMLGYPYLQDMPHAPLEDPKKSVDLIVDFIKSPEKLIKTSVEIKVRHKDFIKSQENIWKKTLFDQE